MPEAFDLLVLGDVNPDLVLHGGNVEFAFGQAERLVDEANLTVGGSGAILACGAARLGLRVALCGVVGDDLFGRYVCDEIRGRGVDTQGVLVDAERPTGFTVVLSSAADRGMLTVPGAIGAFRADRLDPELLAAARHVHVSSYFLQRGLLPGLPGIFDRVRAGEGTTSVDPNWDPAGVWDGGLLDLLGMTDVFLPNEIEATRVAHISQVDLAITALTRRAQTVVVKTGRRGAVAGGRGGPATVAGLSVAVRDTTGAGDSFDAGFLAAWLGGEPLERALAVANACGALSTLAIGGVDGQPTMEEALAAVDRGSAA